MSEDSGAEFGPEGDDNDPNETERNAHIAKFIREEIGKKRAENQGFQPTPDFYQEVIAKAVNTFITPTQNN